MLGGNLDGLVEVGTLKKVKATDPFPRLGERTVGDQYLALRRRTVTAWSTPLRRLPRIRAFRRSISSTQSPMLSSSGAYFSPSGSTHTNIT